MNPTELLLEEAAERFTEIADWWVELHGDRTPGSRRRVLTLDLTAEQIEERAALDRKERAERDALARRGITPLGHSPAPTRIDVLDVAVDATYALLELEDNVRESLGEQFPARRPVDPRRFQEHDAAVMLAITRRADSRPALVPPRGRPSATVFDPKRPGRHRHTPGDTSDVDRRPADAAKWLALHAHRVNDPHLASHMEAESRRILYALRRAVGTAEQVLRIPADCPICSQRSLRMFADRDQVACVSNSCRCDEEDCGCHDEPARRHKWKRERWGWLSKLIGIDLYDFGRKAS